MSIKDLSYSKNWCWI